ncbi:MAG: helix-turn-helix transcriptional regulator [Calditrichae bacterium]|nr:helix-turn-helix transcriptional regulator [Calditrichia bacterium]
MKPFLEHINPHQNNAIIARKFIQPNVDIPWHFHPEYEIILINKSRGKVFVADAHTSFDQGDIFFIGSNVPHLFINDQEYYENVAGLYLDIVVVHFRKDLFDGGIANYTESQSLKNILSQSMSGLKILGDENPVLAELLIKMPESKGMVCYSGLINFLTALEKGNSYTLLAEKPFSEKLTLQRPGKLEKLDNFLVNHYHENITVSDASNLIGMNTSSFCRYFKKHTRMTFSDYLNQLRINYACRLLLNNTLSVSQICYEVGYNNISHFNRQFKRICKKTPQEYKKDFHAI